MASNTGGLDFDAKTARAVIVGSSRFPKDPERLPPLPAVVANIVDLERILLDPNMVGIPHGRVTRILDETDSSSLGEKILDAADEAESLLLFYYSGHGLIGKSGDLLLTLPSSTYEHAEANCVRWEIVKQFILRSRATRKIIILDCCFSGRAANIMATDEAALRGELEVKGTIVISSSARNEPSLALDGDRRTLFTDALLSTMEHGLNNERNTVSIDEVFTNAAQVIKAAGGPTPQRIASAEANDIALVRNMRMTPQGPHASVDLLIEAVERRLKMQDGEIPILSGATAVTEPSAPLSRPALTATWLTYLVIALFETIILVKLGNRRQDIYAPSGGNFFDRYPNFYPFALSTLLLLGTSVSGLFLFMGALKDPRRSTLRTILLLSPRTLRVGIGIFLVNIFLVVFLGTFSPFFPSL